MPTSKRPAAPARPVRSASAAGAPPRPRPARKRRGQYHHGDLRRALLQQAVRTIQAQGVQALTLRAVGEALGVSRTALYRHFADKAALLSAVAAEGFRMLRDDLVVAWEGGGRGRQGFEAMGVAYVHFAVTHPSHYRVMFGAVEGPMDPELEADGAAAFDVLVQSLVAQQKAGLMRPDDPVQLAQCIWSLVHGIAMLTIDGQLRHLESDADGLTRYAVECVRSGVEK